MNLVPGTNISGLMITFITFIWTTDLSLLSMRMSSLLQIAFTVAKAIPLDMPVIALGIFVAGCCPGGGGSNMYSYLLNGDLDLSITMTALSTIFALGECWYLTLTTKHILVGFPFTISRHADLNCSSKRSSRSSYSDTHG